MQPVYKQNFLVDDLAVDCFGRLKTSMILYYMQEVAGKHFSLLEDKNQPIAGKNLFWAVTRHRVEISRLPEAREVITLKTWPCPTTRVAYPRATVACDAAGHELFRVMSLWVLMDVTSRAMILPGKSGVLVEGVTVGSEIAVPLSLPPAVGENTEQRRVRFTDLDVNGHMNNTQYLNWVEDLLPGIYHRENPAREFTICYLSEAREGQTLDLHWTLDDALRVDAQCRDPEDPEKTHRIFAAKVIY